MTKRICTLLAANVAPALRRTLPMARTVLTGVLGLLSVLALASGQAGAHVGSGPVDVDQDMAEDCGGGPRFEEDEIPGAYGQRPGSIPFETEQYVSDNMDRGVALLQARQHQEAERYFQDMRCSVDYQFGRGHPLTVLPALALAEAVSNQGRRAQALQLLEFVSGAAIPESASHAVATTALTRSAIEAPSAGVSPIIPARALLRGVQARRQTRAYDLDPRSVSAPEQPRYLPPNLVSGYESQAPRFFSESAAMTDQQRLVLFADAAWQGGSGAERLALQEEVFRALQDSTVGPGGAAVNRLAMQRYLDRAQALGGLIEQRRALLAQRAGRDVPRQRFDELTREVRALEARVRAEFPDYADLVQPRSIGVSALQAVLRSNEALLLVVPGPYGTHSIAVTPAGIAWNRSDWNADRVAGAVERLRFDSGALVDVPQQTVEQWESRPATGTALSFNRRLSYDLHQQIVAPLSGQLGRATRLYIVASGALAALPFSVLVTESPAGPDDDPERLRSTSWLADRFALVHLPTVQSLELLRSSARPGPTETFLGFGDPEFTGPPAERGARNLLSLPAAGDPALDTAALATTVDGEALRRLPRLPGTLAELAALERLFPNRSTIFTGASASEAMVRGIDLTRATVITFATHGLTPADPVRAGASNLSAADLFGIVEPGLVLTPPETPSELDDGYLAASEVTTLRISGAWVVLSACNSASGDATSTGLSQLARAFFYAGAGSLLASHWPVADDVAEQLTAGALRLQRDDPAVRGRPEAFQAAMRAVRMDRAHDETRLSRAHPTYWAPFVLVGAGD